MGLCATCAHWKSDSGYSALNQPLGKCEKLTMFWEATEWDDEGDGRRLRKGHENDKAFTQDGSDYMAHLLTRPDFGCVMHEEKVP